MQFDTLHNKLFDLAKKGALDLSYATTAISEQGSAMMQPRPEFFERKKTIVIPGVDQAVRQRPIHNLKQLQFTLFD